MFVEREASVGEPTSQERRDIQQNDKRILGNVVQCDGARATISAHAEDTEGAVTGLWTVGKMISINLGSTRTVGLVYAIGKSDRAWNHEGQNPIEVSVELVGEVRDGAEPGSKPVFDRGITTYPHIGAVAHRIRSRDLQAVYDLAGRHSVTIGTLSQDESIDANIAIDDTLARHFAIVGTTGVGKSTAVSLLLRKTIEARSDLRVLILDPHNEFAASLPEYCVKVDSKTLDLPFWMFRLEEFAEVLFRGRETVPEEVDALRDLIPAAKNLYRNPNSGTYIRRGSDALTADTPVPYRVADLIKQIDERMGMLESKNDRPILKSLKTRIESAAADPRYRFMFNSRLIEDTIHETIGNIFRVPSHGRPVTCFEMAGMPSEVVNSVCSVLARLAFDLALWSEGRLKLLLLCEEAHRYMPADPRLGFAPTRHALSRIAKEGRKYGCYLGVVTQRPGELDPTILSQCSTFFAMRLANEQDQAIIRSAIADSSASTLAFLSSMGQREAIAFGEGVATTMRLKFEKLAQQFIPGTAKGDQAEQAELGNDVDLAMVVERLRNVPKPTQSMAFAEAVDSTRQAGDPDYKKPAAATRAQPDDDFDTRYGLKPSTFGMRQLND
ncbi:ATP-binding protein [Mesorhizobium sp. M2D.F.Ca.ET.185.01.1.1]|uniref:ATP-binding protein n=1 Tax=unclassified Mesorhizobium TaxID=325217 RepID=UPI000FCC2561|nr:MULTISPECIES: ATP-binding protein [unclassified Mesorhizobium]TGP80351.1 ATP-binding protein [bacterium M00.F.Ca.ET.227.01.1.1]TGQ00680.1 ATP-binding protein [bacterium M00.F.Ca.ET.221.01.1.1]TGQ02799.1 ATP-binding protein [bacterium M00.F.Ca.ET.222.01.1.1]TGU01569.1 ATP-binding protein [bacterium M00.F.Ca.ET.163.01.1.1]TGU32424.1 ATP-binding protein [bacterium M00.F.Ca.ET.156.01.1.1]TGU44740.1 ATP-binding protein [bacterium M00.F.Ca.ET.146.01.1.1]TGV72414.1 ATP-binding protein [Mesorhizo